MADDKKTEHEKNYREARAELISESNQAHNKGDFVTSHHIDRVLKVAEQIKQEKEQKGN